MSSKRKTTKGKRTLVNRKDRLGRTGKKQPFVVSDGILQLAVDGKDASLKDWGIKLADTPTSRTGDRVVSTTTKLAYKGHYENLTKFCYLIGDYDSVLILDKKCPEYAPSVKVETLVLYLHFKFHDKTELLTDVDGKTIHNKEGGEIYCTATWNDPGNADHFRAAINALHHARGHRHAYVEFCKDCKALPNAQRFKGCPNHPGDPRFRRTGNPVCSSKFENCLKQIKKDGETYVIRGCDQLMPGELRQLGNYLRSSNNLKDLQTLTVKLVSVKAFLRADDLGIEMCHFHDDLSLVTDRGVENICLTVKGKSDPAPVYLLLWCDDDCPDLCPVRHLLIYIFLAGIKDGYLFCSVEELKERPIDGTMQTSITYENIKTRLQFLFSSILKNEEKILGVHSLRKTAYLLAKLGDGALSETMLAARHKSVINAMKYEKDAGLLRDLLQAQPDPHHRVSPFKSVRCQDPKVLRSINARNRQHFKSLPELAADFVYKHLKVAKNDPKIMHPSYLLTKALAWRRDQDAMGEFTKVFEKFNMLGESRDEILRCATLLAEERLAAAYVPTDDSKRSVGDIGPTDAELKKTIGPKPRKRGTGVENLDERQQLASCKTTAAKLQILLRLESLVPAGNRLDQFLTGGALTFYKKYIKKVRTCLDAHFQKDNIDGFASRYPSYSHTKWKCTCECGE